MFARISVALGALLLSGACAAPPPPITVDTPFGLVRAESEDKAEEVADMLSWLSPGVREVLPGTVDRSIDVWVQSVLRNSRNGARADGVKGFTLLSSDFEAKRIHLLEDGELSWYLSHELVHALVDESWKTLPGILEEGLGDVVAEMLNEEYADRIRAHRLFTSSGFFDGVLFRLAYRTPEEDGGWVEAPMRLTVVGEDLEADVGELLSLSRRDLRKEYGELPEPFYGLAYLIVSRIAADGGLERLHQLCAEANAEGLAVVPTDRILDAAGLDLARFGPELLAAEFGRAETRQLLLMQPDMFAETIASYFHSNHPGISTRTLLFRVNPCIRAADGSLVKLRSLWPLRQKMVERWRDR